MKKRTRKQMYSDYADAIKAMKEDKPIKRAHAKDGSIATRPVIDIVFPKSEKIVLSMCLEWLKHHRVFCNRHDAGTFQNVRGQWATYGIKDSGDIHGMVGPYGIHFEIETKRGKGGRLSIGQQKRMRDIRNNNSLYFVVHDVSELIYYFKELI